MKTLQFIALFGLLIIIGSCFGGGQNVSKDQNPEESWALVDSNATETLMGISGTAANDIWVCGLKASINPRTVLLHWDGTDWIPSSFSAAYNLLDVWGDFAGTLYAGGMNSTLLRYSGTQWAISSFVPPNSVYGLFGFSADDVWVVGLAGGISHKYSGWNAVSGAGAGDWLWDVWGATPSDVWIVGHADGGVTPKIYRWNGSTLVSSFSLPASAQGLWAVWGAAANDVWVCGKSGTLLHWNGVNWISYSLAIDETLHAVWGTSSNNVWVGGQNGVVYRWDGANWNDVSPLHLTNNTLWGIWGTTDSVWFVGANGTILNYKE